MTQPTFRAGLLLRDYDIALAVKNGEAALARRALPLTSRFTGTSVLEGLARGTGDNGVTGLL